MLNLAGKVSFRNRKPECRMTFTLVQGFQVANVSGAPQNVNIRSSVVDILAVNRDAGPEGGFRIAPLT